MTSALAASSLRTLPDVFRRVVAQHGDRSALESDRTRLTYAELDRLSNGVAHALLRRGGREPIAMVTPLENHISMVGEPYLATLSEILREELARAMGSRDGPR